MGICVTLQYINASMCSATESRRPCRMEWSRKPAIICHLISNSCINWTNRGLNGLEVFSSFLAWFFSVTPLTRKKKKRILVVLRRTRSPQGECVQVIFAVVIDFQSCQLLMLARVGPLVFAVTEHCRRESTLGRGDD